MSGDDSTVDVELRPIPDFPGYSVSADGRILSFFKPGPGGNIQPSVQRERKQNRHQDGHRFVGLSRNGTVQNVQVHRAVLLAFVGKCPDGMECRDLNGIPFDNRLENLCWGTRKENNDDYVRMTGKWQNETCGEDHPRAKLTKPREVSDE